MDPDAARPLVTSIIRFDWPGIRTVRGRLFEQCEESMSQFFLDMLAEPLTFTRSQADFHRALEAAGAIRYTTQLINTPVVTYYGDPYPELGTRHIDLVAFIEGFCTLLENPVLLRNTLRTFTQLPSRVARTAFFYSRNQVTYPLRNFFLDRFFATDSPERDAWLLPTHAYAQTPEMVDLSFMEAVLRESNPVALSEQVKNRLRLCLERAEYSTFDTMNGAIQRTMETTSARCIMTIYSYFMHRVVPLHSASTTLADTITLAQRYFELMFCMLMGYDLSDVMPLVATVPLNVLNVASAVAEEVRSFLRDPATGGNELLRATYQRTMEFDRVYYANMLIRNVIVHQPEARRELTLFYVPCYDVDVSELVSSMCEQYQVLQMRSLQHYFERISRHLGHQCRLADLITAQTPESLQARTRLNRELYACNFGGGVHLHRVLWTVSHYAALVPMLENLPESTYVGLDSANRVYMIMPRALMEQLRLAMFVDSATMRNYRKPTAIYPLLLRLYISRRLADHQGSATMNQLSLMAVGSVLGYWLCVPAASSLFSREGMPRIDQSPGVLGHVHDLVALLYRQAVARDAPHLVNAPQDYSVVANLGVMNAVRSFLMSNSMHHMGTDNVKKMLVALPALQSDVGKWLCSALEVLVVVGANAPSIKPTGRRGRPKTAPTVAPNRLRTDSLFTASARRLIAKRDPSNPLVSCSDQSTLTLFNLWVYTVLLTPGWLGDEDRDALLRDFLTLTPALDESFWRNKYTNYSPEVVNTWALASDYLCHAPPSDYCHVNHQLRPECTNANDMMYFILFLQQFERLVCLPNSSSSRAAAMQQGDIALVNWLRELYSNQERLMRAMPVSTYYDSGDRRHHAASFEESMAIAEVMPSTAAQAGPVSHTPTLCVHDYRSTQLSQTAIDLAMSLGSQFKENEAKDPALCQRVYSQILSSAKPK